MGKASIKRPPDEAPATRYEDDLYSWVQEQIALLRAGRLTEIDALNVAEELSDVGKSERDKLQSAITVLTQHLLKWDHQPERRTRSWVFSIREQRRRIEQVLVENPGLKSKLGTAMTYGYANGRDRALDDTGLSEVMIPEVCPFTFEQIMTRAIVLE